MEGSGARFTSASRGHSALTGTALMPMPIELRPDVHVARDPAGCVLLDLRRGSYYSINAIGSVLLTAIEQHTDMDATYAALSAQYGVCMDVLRSDGGAFIARLMQLGLLIERGNT